MKRVYNWIRAKVQGFRDVVTYGVSALSPAGDLRLQWKNYYTQMKALNPQAGAVNTNMVVALFISIVLLVVVIQFLWQQGIPAVIEATSNTTALTDAGATTSQINWVTFIGGIIVILLIIAALVMAVRSAGLGGGGGGGRRRRRR